MARLNPNPPSSVRSATVDVDSLYEGRSNVDQSPAPERSPNGASDKENGATSHPKAGKSASGMNPPTSRMPLRNSNANNKRRRLDTPLDDTRNSSRAGSVISECPVQLLNTQYGAQEVKNESDIYYDPDQDEAYRSGLRASIRINHQRVNENRSEYLKGSNRMLIGSLAKGDKLMDQVRQTSDAVIDSRFLLGVAELAQKKLADEARGKGSRGVDIEEFITKAISYMRKEEEAADPTRRRQTQAQPDEVDDYDADENGDSLPWAIFGENAAIPCNGRPAVASFLFGPLSVQKKIRQTQASARQRRDPISAMKKPEAIDMEELEKSQSANVIQICKDIRAHLDVTIKDLVSKAEEECPDDATDDERCDLLRRHGLSSDFEISLFEYAINPSSFAQSVENMFYISFLIKDGHVSLSQDSDGLPTIRHVDDDDTREKNLSNLPKHQAIFSLDYDSWEKLIKAFDMTASMIPNRNASETQVGANGWYA